MCKRRQILFSPERAATTAMRCFVAMVATLLLSACSDEMGVADGKVTPEIFASRGAVKSRSTGDMWEANDAIGVSTGLEGYNNAKYVTLENTNIAHFHAADAASKIDFGETDSVSFKAYYPYSPGAVADYPNNIPVDTRNQKDQKAIDAIDFLSTPYITVSKANPVAKFQFSHEMSRLQLLIVPGRGMTSLDTSSLRVVVENIKLTGTFSYFLSVNPAPDAELASWDITNNYHTKSGNGVLYDMLVIPQQWGYDQTTGIRTPAVTFSVYLGESKYTAKMPVTWSFFLAGYCHKLTIKVNNGGIALGNSTITPWELVNGGSGSVTLE